MKKSIVFFSLFLTFVLLPIVGFAQDLAKPEVMVVKFHADWCKLCKPMGSCYTELSDKFDGKEVLFTVLDFTNDATRHQANLMASALGIDEIVAQTKGVGMMLVIDAETKEVKDRLITRQSTNEMASVINSYL